MQKIAALEICNLTVSYHESPVLLDVNCMLPQGILCALIGPNGAGKTTLLKTIVNLEKPFAGIIKILNTSYKYVCSRVAYVPQRTTVDWDFPATVFDVVMMGRYHLLGWFSWPKKKDKEVVYNALEQVGMLHYAHIPIGKLSGGQQQRVFLARALVQEADIFFMDEPFVGIDATTEQLLITLLKHMRNAGKTIIIVHHDLQTLYTYFDWAILINRSIISYGSINTVITQAHMHKTFGRSDMIIPSIPSMQI